MSPEGIPLSFLAWCSHPWPPERVVPELRRKFAGVWLFPHVKAVQLSPSSFRAVKLAHCASAKRFVFHSADPFSVHAFVIGFALGVCRRSLPVLSSKSRPSLPTTPYQANRTLSIYLISSRSQSFANRSKKRALFMPPLASVCWRLVRASQKCCLRLQPYLRLWTASRVALR